MPDFTSSARQIPSVTSSRRPKSSSWASGQPHIPSVSKQKYSIPSPVSPPSATIAVLKFLKFAIRPPFTPGPPPPGRHLRPHLPAPPPRVAEGVDERLDDGMLSTAQRRRQDGIPDHFHQVQTTDPLPGPIRGQLAGRNPPDLLRIGLEEDF